MITNIPLMFAKIVSFAVGTATLLICQLSSVNAQSEQQPDRYIAGLWQVYLSQCGLALTDPQGFLNSLPATNTRGGPSSVLTADGVVLVSSTSHDGFTVDVDMISVSDGLDISCHVFPSVARFFELEDFSAIDIENALRDFLVSQGLQGLSGGEIGNAFSGSQDGDEQEYLYIAEGLLSGTPILTRFEMTEGDLAVYFAGVTVPAGN